MASQTLCRPLKLLPKVLRAELERVLFPQGSPLLLPRARSLVNYPCLRLQDLHHQQVLSDHRLTWAPMPQMQQRQWATLHRHFYHA